MPNNDLKVYEWNPNKLPTNFLRAIGLVVTASAQNEHVVDMFVHRLIGAHPIIGHAVTAQAGLPQRVAMLRSLANARSNNKEHLAAIEAAVRAVEKAAEIRNSIAHRAWYTDPDDGSVYNWKVTAKKKLEVKAASVSAASLEADAALIYQAGIDLMTVLTEHERLYGPEPNWN